MIPNYSVRAYVGLYRTRYKNRFSQADESVEEFSWKHAREGGNFIIRKVCSVYGQFDFIILVDATSLSALHTAVQSLGEKHGIGDTETLIANSICNPTPMLEISSKDSVISFDCNVLCLSVKLGYPPDNGFDEWKGEHFAIPTSDIAEGTTFSDHVAQILRVSSRVISSDAVFGKFDVIAILEDRKLRNDKGHEETVHQFLEKLVEHKGITKTALLRPCPVFANRQFRS